MADPDLELRGGPVLIFLPCWPFSLQSFLLFLPPGPSPRSATVVHDFAHHDSPKAQWLVHPTGILEGHGFDSHWGSENLFPSILTREHFSVTYASSKSPIHLSFKYFTFAQVYRKNVHLFNSFLQLPFS